MAQTYTIDTIHTFKATNLGKTRFGLTVENDVFRPAAAAIKASPNTLYAFDVRSCKMTERTTIQPVAMVDNASFADAVRAYWYSRQLADVDELAAKLSDLCADDFAQAVKDAEGTDAHAQTVQAYELYKVLTARINDIRETLEPYAMYIPDVTVRAYVAAIRRDKIERYPSALVDLLKPVSVELKMLDKVGEDAETVNVKHLREKATVFTGALWSASEREGVCAYTFRCNDALARDIYRAAYKGREMTTKGKIRRAFNDDAAIAAEIVLACIEHMQAKYNKAVAAAKAEDAQIAAEKKEEVKPVEGKKDGKKGGKKNAPTAKDAPSPASSAAASEKEAAAK